MATDFSTRPKLPVLKRFANLEIDGVEKPERRPPTAEVAGQSANKPAGQPSAAVAGRLFANAPRPAATRLNESRGAAPTLARSAEANARDRFEADADLRDFETLAEDLNDNARAAQDLPARSGPRPRFTMPMPDGPAARARAERAAEISRLRPPDPVLPPPPPMRRAPITTQLGVNARLWEAPRALPLRRELYDERDEMELEGRTPGVVTVEMDLRRARPQGRNARPAQTLTPVELTPMAARQIMLMAWEAGVPGSALRILTSNVGGLGRPEIDFAFDEHLEPDDLVYETQGLTIVIDPQSLRWVAGRRINWHDVPGSEGFRVG